MFASLAVLAAKLAGPIAVFTQWLGGNNTLLNITAPTVNAIKGPNTTLYRVVVQAVGSGGTLTLNDVATAAAAAAGNQFYTALTANLTVGQVITLDWPCKVGLCVSACSGGIVVAMSYL
jgi:hypothetical protein